MVVGKKKITFYTPSSSVPWSTAGDKENMASKLRIAMLSTLMCRQNEFNCVHSERYKKEIRMIKLNWR